jgi:hypothetical protein
MGRRRDETVRDFGPGPIANDNQALPCSASALPRDAQALIEPLPGAVSQGGKARAGQWRVRFLPRWAPVAEPLMGWMGGGDPLDQIELGFPIHRRLSLIANGKASTASFMDVARAQRRLRRARVMLHSGRASDRSPNFAGASAAPFEANGLASSTPQSWKDD